MRQYEVAEKMEMAMELNKGLAEKFGLKETEVLRAACSATKALTGVDPMELMGLEYLKEDYLSPEQLRKYDVFTEGKDINTRLKESGYQVAHMDKENREVWSPTVKALEAGVYRWLEEEEIDYEACPAEQLLWSVDLAERLVGTRKYGK